MMHENDCTFIYGFGLAGYRSFGPELQRIGPCAKINLIIGQNNSGKSNIIQFVHDHYKNLGRIFNGQAWNLTNLENHRGRSPVQLRISVALRAPKEKISAWDENARKTGRLSFPFASKFVNELSRRPCGNGFWLDREAVPGGGKTRIAEDFLAELVSQRGFTEFCHNFCLAFMSSATSGNSPANIESALQFVTRELIMATDCVTIPALRRPGNGEPKEGDFSGADIIHRLAKLQNPEHHRQDLKVDFRRIEQFLREVTDRSDAHLEVPYQRDTIIVHMDGRSMPLEALGTGIHEVIILAAAATSLHGRVICIEEPEVHLHPLLQKKLLRFLDEQTDNQYFISTHSAHFLDHPGAAIFHVRLTENGSAVRAVTQHSERFAICTDLGYRASDLLQTNCVIWVEGPSDRIYLREWIRLKDASLTEGIDYSIMFYGGRLLSHLSPSDPEVEDFISLRMLNRNMVVVMDSDRGNSKAPVNSTKQRIIESWKNEPGFAWVTQGREIENYVAPEAMIEALTTITGALQTALPKSIYTRAITRKKDGSPVADKVKVAHWLAEHGKLRLERLDLRDRIDELCQFIRQANHAKTTIPQSA